MMSSRSLPPRCKALLIPVPLIVAMVLLPPAARGQLCLDALPSVPLPPDDQGFLDDFGAALRRFRAMTLDDFRTELGPRGLYRQEKVQFIRGDSNGDGKVDVSDAVCTLSYLFLGEGPCSQPPCLSALDVDDSGKILISDPIRILTYLFLSGTAPPGPFPEPGSDPTPDALSCEHLPGSAMDYAPAGSEHLEGVHPNPLQSAAFRWNVSLSSFMKGGT